MPWQRVWQSLRKIGFHARLIENDKRPGPASSPCWTCPAAWSPLPLLNVSCHIYWWGIQPTCWQKKNIVIVSLYTFSIGFTCRCEWLCLSLTWPGGAYSLLAATQVPHHLLILGHEWGHTCWECMDFLPLQETRKLSRWNTIPSPGVWTSDPLPDLRVWEGLRPADQLYNHWYDSCRGYMNHCIHFCL